MEWWEEDKDDLPKPVFDLLDEDLVGDFTPVPEPELNYTPVPEGFFDMPPNTGFGDYVIEDYYPEEPPTQLELYGPEVPPTDLELYGIEEPPPTATPGPDVSVLDTIEPLSIGYDPIDTSDPISGTTPTSDTIGLGLDPIDYPDEPTQIQPNDAPYVNVFGVGIDLPDIPAFQRAEDNFNERVESPRPSGEMEALSNPFPDIAARLGGAYEAEMQRTEYAIENEKSLFNVWLAGRDAPTREEAGVAEDAPGFGGAIGGPLLETGGQIRRNIMRLETVGDGLRMIGQNFTTLGDLAQATLQDAPFKTRVGTGLPVEQTQPSIGRVARNMVSESLAPFEGMLESPANFLGALRDASERSDEVPWAFRFSPLGVAGFRYLDSLGNEMGADRALSDELGFDVALPNEVLTDEQEIAVGLGELNAYSPGAVQATIRDIYTQDQRVSALQQRAQAALNEASQAMAIGDMDEAGRLSAVGARLGDQAYRESQKDPFDYVDKHTSLWNEILFSSVLDFSPLISGPLEAIGLSAIPRRISKAASVVDVTPEEYIKRVTKATVKDEAIINQVGRHNYFTDIASLGLKPTDRSYANRAMYAVHRGITAVGSMVTNKEDMRKILTRWLDEPKKMAEGFDDLRSPGLYLRSTDDGKAYFGLGAFGTDAMLEARKALLAVRDEFDNLLSLTGDDALNHRVFYDELRELAYKGELKRRGSLSYEMPIGTGFVEAGTDDAGNAVVRYYNQKAKKDRRVIREDSMQSETRANRIATKQNKRIGDFRTGQADINLLEEFASLQRGIMSPMVLDLSPRGLVRHVISNASQLMADGVYKLERIDDQLEYIAKKYEKNDFLTARQADAFGDDVRRAVRGAYDYGNFRVAGAIQRIPFIRKLREARSGAAQLGSSPIGEESYSFTAGVQAARKFFRRYAPSQAKRFGDELRAMGKNEAFIRNAESRLSQAMIDGGSEDVGRVFREIVNDGSLQFSLADYGPYMDVLGTAGVGELEAIMRRSYGRDRDEVLAEVRGLFDRRTTAAQATLAQTGIEPAQTINDSMDGLWDVAELTRDMRMVMRKAGFSEGVAEGRIQELKDRMQLAYEQGRNSLVEAVIDVDDPRSTGWMINTYRQVRESRAVRDEAQSAVMDRIMPIVQSGTEPEIRAAWEKFFQETDELYRENADRVRDIYDNAIQAITSGELPEWVDAYDQMLAATRLDAGALETAMDVDLGSVTRDQPIYREVMEAGRNFIERSRARAYWSGIDLVGRDRNLGTLFFNVLASAEDDIDAIWLMTRGQVAEARERLLPGAAEEFYKERNTLQVEGVRAAQERWEAAAKELALHKRLREDGLRNPLEFSENLIDDDLDARLGEMVDESYIEHLRLLREADDTEAAFYGRFGQPEERVPRPSAQIVDPELPESLISEADELAERAFGPTPDDRGAGENIYSAATVARREREGLIETRRTMEAEWDLARAGAPGDVSRLPSLQQARNAYQRSQIPDNDDWRNMVDALVEGSSFQEFEAWLGRYDQTFEQAKALRDTIRDSERFRTDTGRRLSRDEILATPDVQETLGDIGYYSPDDARRGTRRDLLDILADAEGKMDGDYQSYFYSGVPLPAMYERMFNIEEGSLLKGMWKNTRRSSAQGNVRNRLDQGTAARARIDAARDAESSLARDVDRWIYGRNEQYKERFTPAERQVLTQYLSEDIMPSFDNLLAGASLAAENVSSFVMVDFANGARHIDNLIGAGVPYHFWYTRAFKNMLERIMTEPGYVSRTANYYQEMGNYHEQEDSPLRNRNRLPLPFLTMPNGDRILVSDPLTALMPPVATNYQLNEFADPEAGKTGLTRTLRYLDMVGISFAPWWRAMIEGADGQTDMFAGEVIPPYQDLGWIAQGITGLTLPGSLPDYHPYFPARQARNAAETGEITDFDSKMIMDMARRTLTGEELLPEQQGGDYEKRYQKFVKRGAWEKAVPKILSHVLGFNFSTQPQSELNIREGNQVYNNLGYDATTNPFGSAAAARYVLQNGDPVGDLPLDQLDTQFSLNSVTREQDSMRPGVAAVTDRAIARENEIIENLNGLAVAASEATILAHPDQKPERGDEIAAGRQAVMNNASEYLTASELLELDENQSPFMLAKQVADIVNARENPSASKFQAGRDKRNPREKAGDQLQKLVEANAVGKAPNYPGQNASDDLVQKYYTDKNAHLMAKLEYIERVGGRITMEDDGPIPSEADMLLAEMLKGEYAADMVRNYKHRYATAIQENYYNRLELDTVYRQYVDNERLKDVEARFGAEGLRVFQEYRKLPKGGEDGRSKEQKAFVDKNPLLDELNLFAYNGDDYEYARANFGNDIFDLIRSYPKGDQSGADMKAWNSQYNQSTKDKVFELMDWRGDWKEQVQAIARQKYGNDIIELSERYPSTNKGYTKAQRNAWIKDNQEAYARLKDYWEYDTAQDKRRDAQQSDNFDSATIAALGKYPYGQGDPRKAEWKKTYGQGAKDRIDAYFDWYRARTQEKVDLVAPDIDSDEALAMLRYGRDPIGPETAGSVSGLVQGAQVGELSEAAAGANSPGEIDPGTPLQTTSSVQAAQVGAGSGAVSAEAGAVTESGEVVPGTVTEDGADNFNQRMDALWTEYRALPDNAAKAKFLREKTEFAAHYQEVSDIADDDRWWLSSRYGEQTDADKRIDAFWKEYKALPDNAAKAKFLRSNAEFAAHYQSSNDIADDDRWWLSSRYDGDSGSDSDFEKRMDAFWEQYKKLPNSAAKAQFLLNNEEFADHYQKSLGLSSNDRWWLRSGSTTSSSRSTTSSSSRRYSSRSSFTSRGGGGQPTVVQSSPYFASLASGARNVPRLSNQLWTETPWPVYRIRT